MDLGRSLATLALGLAVGVAACSVGNGGTGELASDSIGDSSTGESTSGSDTLTTGISAANASATATATETGGSVCTDDDECPELDGDLCTWPRCMIEGCFEVPADCNTGANACADGSCDASSGRCRYQPNDDNCTGDGCQDGGCIIDQDGQGVDIGSHCETTPLDGPDCDDDDLCTDDDVCVDGLCTGTAMSCDVAPVPSCNGDTLTYSEAPGACQQGECGFVETLIACPLGCVVDTCTPPTGPVISEVLYDDPDADNDVWIELWAPPGSSLAGVTIEFVNGSDGGVDDTFALSGMVPSDGLVLIVDPDATDATLLEEQDFLDNIADLQNGPDNVRVLVDAVVVDSLGFGTFGGGDVFSGEGTAAPDTDGGESLARYLSHVDTDDNADDFFVDMTPTPGALNQ